MRNQHHKRWGCGVGVSSLPLAQQPGTWGAGWSRAGVLPFTPSLLRFVPTLLGLGAAPRRLGVVAARHKADSSEWAQGCGNPTSPRTPQARRIALTLTRQDWAARLLAGFNEDGLRHYTNHGSAEQGKFQWPVLAEFGVHEVLAEPSAPQGLHEAELPSMGP